MLTLDALKEMPPRSIFAQGETTDDGNGINMAGTGKIIRWVATRGDIHDWSVYTENPYDNDEPWPWTQIQRVGDKVHDETDIRRVVPCTDEAFRMYNH